LWQHEYYFVIEKYNGGPPKPYIYQSLEFRKGSYLPGLEKENMMRKQLRETWVLGVAYAPALDIRKQSRREKGYLFHTEVNDTDARTGLFWKCPEVVRVDNSTAWRAMSSIFTHIPRVVHLDDVYGGEEHVAGRHLHYVCGMCCHETVAKKTKTGKEQEGPFRLQRLMREEGGQQCKDGFCTYAEERLGTNIYSAGIMWEMIEELFHGIRNVMSESGRARSGSFKLTWSSAQRQFWEVIMALTFAYSNVFTVASNGKRVKLIYQSLLNYLP
jgi:hypothetical protein